MLLLIRKLLCIIPLILLTSLTTYARDIEIISVRTEYDGYFKRGLWQPIQISITSKSGFNGEVVAKTDANVKFATDINMPPNSMRKIVLPVIFFTALPVLDITARLAPSYEDIPAAEYSYNGKFEEVSKEDILIGVDKMMIVAMPPMGIPPGYKGGRVFFHIINIEDIMEFEKDTTLESVDALMLRNQDSGIPVIDIWNKKGGLILSRIGNVTLPNLLLHREVVNSFDSSIYEHYKSDEWRGVNRGTLTFVLIVYVLAIFVFCILSYVKILPSLWLWISIVLISLVACIVLLLAKDINFSQPTAMYDTGKATFVRANRDGVFSFSFKELRKPIFFRLQNKDRFITIRIREGSYSIEAVSMKRGEVICFAY